MSISHFVINSVNVTGGIYTKIQCSLSFIGVISDYDMWTVNVKDHENLILIRSGTTIDYADTLKALNQIYLDNEGRHSAYKRFVDLSNLKDMNTHFDSIIDQIQQYRKINQVDSDVKVAAYAPFGVLRAIIEIYVQEDGFGGNGFMVSNSIDECADYLSVDKELLIRFSPHS